MNRSRTALSIKTCSVNKASGMEVQMVAACYFSPPLGKGTSEWLWRDTQTCSCHFKGNDTAVEYQDEILRHIVRSLAGAVVPGFLEVHDNICSSCSCVYLQFLDGCPDIVGSTHTLMSSSFEEIQGFILIW